MFTAALPVPGPEPRHSAGTQKISVEWMCSLRTARGQEGQSAWGGDGEVGSQDTLVINAVECEAGVGEAGKAIPVQPGPQGDVL